MVRQGGWRGSAAARRSGEETESTKGQKDHGETWWICISSFSFPTPSAPLRETNRSFSFLSMRTHFFLNRSGVPEEAEAEQKNNRRPHISSAFLWHDGIRRAGTARPTHPCTWGIASFLPDNSIVSHFCTVDAQKCVPPRGGRKGMAKDGATPRAPGGGYGKGRPGRGGLGGSLGGGGQPAREPMMETRGMKRAMTMEPTTTARKMISKGSMMEVMEATALSTSSS